MAPLRSLIALALLFAFALPAAETIRIRPEQFQLVSRAALDPDVKTGDAPSVRLSTTSDRQVARAEFELSLDPAIETYELSFYLKVENIVSAKPDSMGADLWLKPAKGGALRFSSRGTYKSDTGTFDWKKATYRVNVKRYLKERPAKLLLILNYASGTAWFDQITLTPIESTTGQATAAPDKYTFGIFPMCYQKPGEVYEIAENLPAQWTLKCLARPPKPAANSVVFEIELPDFLGFGGIGGFLSQVGGKYFPKQAVQESAGRPGYRKYTIPFDSLLRGIVATNWRRNCMMLHAKPGSAGKSGFCHWTIRVDGAVVSQGSDALRVAPPIRMSAPPCRYFRVGLFSPVAKFSPFRGGPEDQAMTAFWHSLTVQPPMLFARVADGPAPGYERILHFGGFDLQGWLALPAFTALQKAMPPRTGKSPASWYLLDDPDGAFAAYLDALFPHLRRECPDTRALFLNLEPYLEQGYDQRGRERFARVAKLDHTPTPDECKGPLRHQWEAYMLELHRQLLRKVADRIHAEGYQMLLCANKIDSRFGPGTWTSGIDAIHADRLADLNLVMGYSIGTKFFDDIALNVKHQTRPVFPGQDPAEEYRAWFDIYTPQGVRQNIVAAAALGCPGLWYYPTDMLSAQYLRAITEGYSMVSRYEPFYRWGIRRDQEIRLVAKNSASRTVAGPDGKFQTAIQ